MRRFLLLWLVLALLVIAVGVPLSILVFHHVDLRFTNVLHFLVVPTVQATVLLWVAGHVRVGRVVSAVRETVRHPITTTFIAADIAFLATSWLLPGHPLLGIAAESSIHPTWRAVKAIAAGLLIAGLALRRGWSVSERARLLLAAVAALALGTDSFAGWLKPLPRLLLPHLPTVLRWSAVYGTLFVLIVLVLLAAGTVLGRHSWLAASLVDTALAFGFAAALVAVANVYLRPFLVEPWASLAFAALSLAATLTLAGALLAWRASRPSAHPAA